MHLSDCFLELFTFIRYVTDASNVVDADYETVRADVDTLIQRLEKKAYDFGATPEQFDMARFAAFAWADEAILCSDWSGTRRWLKSPLQRDYYGTANAGEEFFDRLDTLLSGQQGQSEESVLGELVKDNGQSDNTGRNEAVLEVYTLCLALGYTGKYFGEGDQASLERLRQNCIKRIVGKQKGASLSAFPDAYGSGVVPKRDKGYWRVFDPLAIVFILLPLLVVAGIFLAYQGLLEYSLNLWFG